MNNIELEIKCLIGTQENADTFLLKLEEFGIDTKTFIKPERQLNHYFSGGNILDIHNKFSSQMPLKDQEALYHICIYGRNHSLRTRSILPWDKTILVIKSSNTTDDSHNGVTRTEFEYHFPDMILEEMDRILLDLWWEYLSKWSRIRTQYNVGDIAICLDENAWYGYLAEFETILTPGEDTVAAEARIRSLMSQLGACELSQNKLEQMFTHYNASRPDYYGTSRTFDMLPDGSVIRYGFDDGTPGICQS